MKTIVREGVRYFPETHVNHLNAEIEELKEKCKDLEASRENVLESCKLTHQSLKEELRRTKDGAFQIDQMFNSIMMYLANKNGGKLRVPKNHMKLTKDWGFECFDRAKKEEYEFVVHKEKKNDN